MCFGAQKSMRHSEFEGASAGYKHSSTQTLEARPTEEEKYTDGAFILVTLKYKHGQKHPTVKVRKSSNVSLVA